MDLLDKIRFHSEGLIVETGSEEFREAEMYKHLGLVNMQSSGYVGGYTFVTVKINNNGRRFLATSASIR